MVGELSGDFASSVAVRIIGFVATICTRQEIKWSPVSVFFTTKLHCPRLCLYERVQSVGLISLSFNWVILHNELEQMQVKI